MTQPQDEQKANLHAIDDLIDGLKRTVGLRKAVLSEALSTTYPSKES